MRDWQTGWIKEELREKQGQTVGYSKAWELSLSAIQKSVDVAEKEKKKAGSKLRQIKDMHKPFLGDLEWKSCSACFSQLPKIPESLFRQNSPLINTSHSLSSSLSGFIGFWEGPGENVDGKEQGGFFLLSPLAPVFWLQLNKVKRPLRDQQT